MKRILLTLAIFAIAISNAKAQDEDFYDPFEGPVCIYDAWWHIRRAILESEIPLNKDEVKISERKTNPESGALVYDIEIIPFRSQSLKCRELIENAKEAFETDREKGYNYGNFQLQGSNISNFGTWIDDSLRFIEIANISDNPTPHILFLEEKCKDNPQMRKFFGLKWTEGDAISGTLYYIISKRPDLIFKERDDRSKQQAMELPQDLGVRLMLIDKSLSKYDDMIEDLNCKIKNSKYSSSEENAARNLFLQQLKDVVEKRKALLDTWQKLITDFEK